jgi:rhodanese-related sulfurtransferase
MPVRVGSASPAVRFGLLVVAIVLGLAYVYAVSSPFKITEAEARRRLAAREIDVVLDVRTDLEREMLGSYPGSIHIPAGDLDVEAAKQIPNKSARILAYCNSGQRARLAAEKLHALGYERAVYIVGTYRGLL